jgi:hypothetical protein
MRTEGHKGDGSKFDIKFDETLFGRARVTYFNSSSFDSYLVQVTHYEAPSTQCSPPSFYFLFLLPDILSNILFANTPNLHSALGVRDFV